LEKIKILHFLKQLLIIFFIALIAIHVYYAFAIHFNTLPFLFSRLGLLIALIVIFNTRNKTTWFLGILLSLYGLFDIIIIGYSEFNPALTDFTSPLSVIFKNASSSIQLLISLLPPIFFFALIIAFSTPIVRQSYGFEAPRIKPKKNYL